MSMAVICPNSSFYDFGMPDLNFPTSTSSRLIGNNNNNNNSIGANNMSNLNLNGAMPMGSPTSTMANVIGQASMPALSAQHLQQQQQQLNSNNQLLMGQLGATNNPFSPPSQLQQHQHALHTSLMQHRLNAAAAVIAAQSTMKTHPNILLHNALSRAVSSPLQLQQQQQQQQQLLQQQLNQHQSSTLNSLIDTFNNHRRLERTQSEPLPQVNTSRYKTELCRPFEEAGECKYGEKCQFAHGMHELRNLQRHPKYKTELCRTFHSVGFCPYGPRCHFVHNAEEARNHNRAVHAAFVRAAAANGTAMPMSPPMSMSTGSDRASPTGSLSPSHSLASFFPEQSGGSNGSNGSSGGSGFFGGASSLSSSSSNGSSSSASSASSGGGQQQQQQLTQQQLQLQFNQQMGYALTQSPPHSPGSGLGMSPISTPPPPQQQQQANGGDSLVSGVVSASSGNSETRLPIFNRLSSTIDAFNHLSM